MSVESAKIQLERAFDDYASECASGDECIVKCAVMPIWAIDRLILEVQASMPCYRDATNKEPCRGVGEPLDLFIDEPLCLSCTARMKLKETADV